MDEIHDRFAEMHANYYTYEWTWAYEKMLDFYGLQADTITAADIVAIVRQWQEAVVGLDKMVYEDAKKEFSLTSMTGFGADGSSEEKVRDFEEVRGVFESNPFVTAVLEHIKVKTELGDRKPDYLVVQHMEPDHSASIAEFLKFYPCLLYTSDAADE